MGSFHIDQVQHLWESAEIGPTADYSEDTDKVFDVRGANHKTLLVKNDGVSGIDFQVLGSIDGGAEYDIEHATGTVGTDDQEQLDFTNLYTHLKVRTKSAGAATVTVKIITSSN